MATIEQYTGTDCTGSDGEADRTLTLSNEDTTYDDNLLVFISGLLLVPTTDFTIVHKSDNSVITFVNIVWDDQNILVKYTPLPIAPQTTTVTKVRLLTNLTTDDISDDDVTSIISEAIKELNGFINVSIIRERVDYLDSTRENKRDGSNTTYYIKNWKGKYLADANDDGNINKDDVTVYLVDSSGTETEATVSSVNAELGQFVLSSAPSSTDTMYIDYDWCYANSDTDPQVELACALLTAAYCYAKINIGMAPQVAFGNTKIYRHMDSFDKYYGRFLKVVTRINSQMPCIKEDTDLF